MENNKRILLTLGIGLVIVILFFFITHAITRYTGFFVTEDKAESDFETCLKEKDITLYINTNDVANSLERVELSDHLKYIDIKNCLRDSDFCVENQVVSFPSWIINGRVINKDINLAELKEYSGCEIVSKENN